MRRYIPWSLIIAILSSSCGLLGIGGKSVKKTPPSPFGATGIPPQLRAKVGDAGTPVEAGGNVSNKPLPLNVTPEKDIRFTDPDNPDAVIPELASILSGPKRGPWEESEAIAKQRSLREGKPLLIWFTDSLKSPMCQSLSQELFGSNEFGKWATEKLVRLRVDASVKITDPDLDLGSAEDRRSRILDYVRELKKRYKVLGFPTLVMLSPSGEVVGTFRGYKRGDAAFVWGQIKHGEVVSSESYKSWRASLEKKGYREWHGRGDVKIFACLISYSKGKLILVEPDGNRARTEETSLSDKDRAWLAEWKKLQH